MNAGLETLLTAAVRALSGDNTQPWRFATTPGGDCLLVYLDEARDPSPMNAGQRMARIACGAAVENILQAVQGHGGRARLVPPTPPALAEIRLLDFPPGTSALDEGITRRVTNRRLYDRRPVPPEVLLSLAGATPPLDGVKTYWVCERRRVEALASLIGRADRCMFGVPSLRQAFLAKVRFDQPPRQPVEEGLSQHSLELSRAERLALRVLPFLPDRLLRWSGALRAFAVKARKLVESASGLCLGVAADAGPPTDVVAGLALERAWLALTRAGLAAQPMMSLLILDNLLTHGPAEPVADLGRDRIKGLLAEFRELLPELAGERPAFLLRFGFAPPPSGRTGRLPLEAVNTEPARESKE